MGSTPTPTPSLLQTLLIVSDFYSCKYIFENYIIYNILYIVDFKYILDPSLEKK